MEDSIGLQNFGSLETRACSPSRSHSIAMPEVFDLSHDSLVEMSESEILMLHDPFQAEFSPWSLEYPWLPPVREDSPIPTAGKTHHHPLGRKRPSTKTVSRLPRSAKNVLVDWLSKHSRFPYPTDQEKEYLSDMSGLSRMQVSQWFANARKRGKRPSELTASLQSPGPIHYGQPELLPYMGSLHPFERWLNLGFEYEAAPIAAVIEEVKRRGNQQGEHPRPPRKAAVRVEEIGGSTNWQFFRKGTSSISSMEIRSYAANQSVDAEQQCLDTFAHLKRLDRRQGSVARKSRSRSQQQQQQLPSSESEQQQQLSTNHPHQPFKFPCTFCEASFKRKHEWQRHEKSCHLPLEKWTCTPHGGTVVDLDLGHDHDHATCKVTCAFCPEVDPSPEHLQTHGYTACAQRPIAERTFYRKDHLRQHLRLTHGVTKWCEAMESWKTQPELVRSRCGFCSAWLDTWQARVDHLADHFTTTTTTTGMSMDQWVGDWGFDPEVALMLENAKLPTSRSTHRGLPPPDSDYYCGDESFCGNEQLSASAVLGSLTEDWGTETLSVFQWDEGVQFQAHETHNSEFDWLNDWY